MTRIAKTARPIAIKAAVGSVNLLPTGRRRKTPPPAALPVDQPLPLRLPSIKDSELELLSIQLTTELNKLWPQLTNGQRDLLTRQERLEDYKESVASVKQQLA